MRRSLPWGADADRIVPLVDGTGPVARPLRLAGERVDVHEVTAADHRDVLAPCTEAPARIAPPICDEPDGSDRAAFHQRLDAALVSFFRTVLHPGRP